MNLSLTIEEGRALVALLDVAVKSQGLSVAPAAVVLAKKIDDADRAEAAVQQSPRGE